VHLTLYPNNLFIDEMELPIPYKNIKRLENMTKDKITAARVVFLGIAGALWKKEQLYTVIKYKDAKSKSDLSLVFKFDKIKEVQPMIYQKMVESKKK
jgi:hypothetical protein